MAEGFDHGICGLDINHATEDSQAADEALMAANARLIAAAPELLGALIASEKKLVELEQMVGGGDDEISVEVEILTARAAIFNATGASQ